MIDAENHLYKKLKKAYTQENLTKISAKLIQAYRSRDFNYIKKLYGLLEGFLPGSAAGGSRMFSSLIMLYHPDRLNYYLAKISPQKPLNDLDNYSHILTVLDNLEMIPASEDTDIDFWCDQYEEYGYDEEDFDRIIHIENELNGGELLDDEQRLSGIDFMSALNLKETGSVDAELGLLELENLQGELDMSSRSIADLDGIEYCRNISVLDLSNNDITDIAALGRLEMLEELYLTGNSVTSIDSLAALQKLKRLDISFNRIDDLHNLSDLAQLEFVNAAGNPLPNEQAEILRGKGIIVIM